MKDGISLKNNTYKSKLNIDYEVLINRIFSFSGIFTFLVLITEISNIPEDYYLFLFMPIIYTTINSIIYKRIIKSNKNKITLYFLMITMWPRMVLLPFLSALTDNYYGFTYIVATSNSVRLANILILYEFIVSAIFLYLVTRISKRINKNNVLRLKGNKVIYWVFILLGLLTFFFVGKPHNLLYFIFIPITSQRIGDVTSTPLVLARQIIILSIAVFSMMMISKYKTKYLKSGKKLYVYLAIFFTLPNILIIVGERRSAIIYAAFVFAYLLIKSFPEYKSRIVKWILGVAVIIFSIMSIYKFFASFSYGSYTESIRQTDLSLRWIYRTLNPYMGSPINVGASLDMINHITIKFTNIFYDFFRSTFGISFLVKGQGTLTSAYYNHYVYNNPNIDVGHVITSIGYGYIYFTAILSPVIICLNIYLSTKLERLFLHAKSYEGAYLWGYMLIRFSTLSASTPPLISGATQTLFTTGLLFIVAIIVNKEK